MKRKFLLPAVALLCVAVAAVGMSVASARRGLLGQLAHAKLERSFAPRLSIPTRYRECTAQPGDSAATVPRETCGTGDPRSIKKLREYVRAGESIHPDSLRASALAGLIWWRGRESTLDDAVTDLETVSRVSGGEVAVLVDLSAAHLLRAERTDNPLDLYKGLEAARRALALEPRNASARFNAALALERMGFAEQAVLEWKAYLAVDSASPWANEVHARMRELLAQPAMRPKPLPGLSVGEISSVASLAPLESDAPGPRVVLRALLRSSAAKVDSFARQYPHIARELGMNVVLSEWGAAVERGESVRADSLLNLADAFGRALVEREKSDSSLVYAVDAIRAVRSNATDKAGLAKAHQAYAAGRGFLKAAHDRQAMDAFTQVVDARPASEALLQWASIYQVVPQALLTSDWKQAARDTQARLEAVNVDRYPALEGHARVRLGTFWGRDGRLSANREQFRLAIECFARAGEAASIADTNARDAEVAYQLGDAEGAYRSKHRYLQVELRDRETPDLHAKFIALGDWAERDEMPYAAWAIYNQADAVAGNARAAIDVVELYAARARVRRAVGDSAGFARDLAYASRWVDSIPPGEKQVNWAAAVVNQARLEGVTLAQMDTAVEVYGGNVVWLAPALVRRADLHLAADSVLRAIADLQRLTDIVRELAEQEKSPVYREAIIEQARSVFDRLVMAHLADSSADEALRALEKGRMSFAPRRAGQVPPGEGPLIAPRGQVAVEYALIGDTLVTWVVSADTILAWRRSIDRDTFLLTVQQARAALESVRAPIPKSALRQLYGWLIRPIANQLGGPGTPLIILADGEVAGVPFAALMDGDRYLIQNHPLRFAATLDDAARPLPEGAGGVLLVADPAFDLIQFAPLARLSGARDEVNSLERFYRPNANILRDSGATREAFIREARRAGVIHYAGHAVFNDVRPERSYLLLAGSDATARLTADSVSTLDLGNVRLVVLSACSTVRSRSGRSGGFAGLSGALLAAGAGGVAGSLWEVDDGLAGPLMGAFHRHFRTMDPTHALRQAQLEMLNSDDAEQSSPAAWAGFRYMGS